MLGENDKLCVLRRHTELRCDLLAKALPYDVRWAPRGEMPPTGGWRFNSTTQRNEIVLNLALDETVANPARPAGLAVKIYLHEVAHSLWSERDLQKIREGLDSRSIPFELFNLFEDARIEARWRRDFGQRFGWTKWDPPAWEETPLDELSPEAIFCSLIAAEHSRAAVSQLKELADAAGKLQIQRVGKILQFFRDATRLTSPYTASSLDLIPLCARWRREFPRPRSKKKRWAPIAGHHHGDDFRLAAEAAEAEGRTVLWGESTRTRPPKKAGDPSGRKNSPDAWEAWDIDAQTTLVEKGCNRGAFDPRLGNRLGPLLARSFPGGMAVVKSIAPGKRLSVRDFARGSDKIYRVRREDDSGTSRVTLVYDCSGSMWKKPHIAGLTLLQILNRLHRQEQIEACVLLTFGTGAVELELPFDPDFLNHLFPRGPFEGIEPCFEKFQDKIRRADVVCVYTDGDICDVPFDRTRWRRQGIETYGLYVGKLEKMTQLREWFDYALVRSTIDQLIVAWANLLKKRRRGM